jgi:potassium-transporting ATPase KdpC subunit
MRRDLIPAAVAVVVFTILCGLAYPLLVTGVSQVVFPGKADGSLIKRDGRVVGSKLIGQEFKRDTGKKDADGNPILVPIPRYFQSRPSATGYAADGTFFNNQGPNQKDLADQLRANADDFLQQNPGTRRSDIPPDAVTTSASGIDPHISKANARIQARRVSRVRAMPLHRIAQLIDANTDGRFLIFGEPGVNVLELNLALDKEQQ